MFMNKISVSRDLVEKSASILHLTKETSIEQTVSEMNWQRIASARRDSKTAQVSRVMNECIQRNFPYRIPV